MRSYSILAVFTGVLSVSALQAGSLAPGCQSGPLSGYLPTFSDITEVNPVCSVGILNFTDFSFTASGTGGANLLTASQIEVTPVANGDLGGGFSFSSIDPAAFAVGAGQTA